MNRELDGCYFRVKRDGNWENICFTDLTKDEQLDVLEGKSAGFITNLCLHLADVIKNIGDEFDIVCSADN